MAQQFGRYEIRQRLGKGMLPVYLAHDPVLGRDVALKLFECDPDLPGRDELRERFLREARTLARIPHANVVHVYDTGEEDGVPFIAMEYCPGQTLREKLRLRGSLEPDEAAGIMDQILAGLHACHSGGVIHRDVKPENVLILPDGTVKVADFGIARVAEDVAAAASGQMFGTPDYMAPEQLKSGRVDQRTDIFAAGVLFHEMLTGRRPFYGADTRQVIEAIVEGRAHLSPYLPARFRHIVMRACAADPQHRYDSAAEMRQAIAAARKAGAEAAEKLGRGLAPEAAPLSPLAPRPAPTMIGVTPTPAPIQSLGAGRVSRAARVVRRERGRGGLFWRLALGLLAAAASVALIVWGAESLDLTGGFSSDRREKPVSRPEPASRWTLRATNLRAGPGVRHRVIRVLKAGERVTVRSAASESGWVRVTLPDGGKGYVSAAQLTDDPPAQKRSRRTDIPRAAPTASEAAARREPAETSASLTAAGLAGAWSFSCAQRGGGTFSGTLQVERAEGNTFGGVLEVSGATIPITGELSGSAGEVVLTFGDTEQSEVAYSGMTLTCRLAGSRRMRGTQTEMSGGDRVWSFEKR